MSLTNHFKPNLKTPTDLAQHYLLKAGITAFRRIRKSDNNRIARYAKKTKTASHTHTRPTATNHQRPLILTQPSPYSTPIAARWAPPS